MHFLILSSKLPLQHASEQSHAKVRTCHCLSLSPSLSTASKPFESLRFAMAFTSINRAFSVEHSNQTITSIFRSYRALPNYSFETICSPRQLSKRLGKWTVFTLQLDFKKTSLKCTVNLITSSGKNQFIN